METQTAIVLLVIGLPTTVILIGFLIWCETPNKKSKEDKTIFPDKDL